MPTTQLTATQQAVLAHAIQHTAGKINWFPEAIKGGARKKVLDALLNRGLVTQQDSEWVVAPQGYDAVGIPQPAPLLQCDPEIEAAVAAIEAKAQLAVKKPRTRDNSKQATVIAMLKRPEGATIQQICESTGWQSHTVRGMFAGAFKKKLGLSIVSEKDEGHRIYRITE